MQLGKDFLNGEVERMGSHSQPKPLGPHTTPLAQTWKCVVCGPDPASSKHKPNVSHSNASLVNGGAWVGGEGGP